ncbi:hypothetical protein ACFYNL_38035 [Streptomyces sp. NPDC007808]|uniref:hypothetical protein n=1 Tax=Streptomyces sp. NPDC007808 TaxID=3364779 RepID=UPI0036826373
MATKPKKKASSSTKGRKGTFFEDRLIGALRCNIRRLGPEAAGGSEYHLSRYRTQDHQWSARPGSGAAIHGGQQG